MSFFFSYTYHLHIGLCWANWKEYMNYPNDLNTPLVLLLYDGSI
jgi:hypothetical protein